MPGKCQIAVWLVASERGRFSRIRRHCRWGHLQPRFGSGDSTMGMTAEPFCNDSVSALFQINCWLPQAIESVLVFLVYSFLFFFDLRYFTSAQAILKPGAHTTYSHFLSPAQNRTFQSFSGLKGWLASTDQASSHGTLPSWWQMRQDPQLHAMTNEPAQTA